MSGRYSGRLQFGVYEYDPASGELRKQGVRIRIQDQPLKVLIALLERPGEVVSREELRQKIWPAETFVDFDQSLNKAVNKVREALRDTADQPRFIETVPRRGYRFIAPVTASEEQRAGPILFEKGGYVPVATAENAVGPPCTGELPATPPSHPPTASRSRFAAATAVALISLASTTYFVLRPAQAPVITGYKRLTNDGHRKDPGFAHVTDGQRLYFAEKVDGRLTLAQVSVNGGETALIPTPMEPLLDDISPDGSKLLVAALEHGTTAFQYWMLPTVGGSPIRLGDIVSGDVHWSRDGSRLSFIQGRAIWVATGDGSNARHLVTVRGAFPA